METLCDWIKIVFLISSVMATSNAQRADVVAHICRKGFEYGIDVALPRAKELILELQPLKSMVKKTDLMTISEIRVRNVAFDSEQSYFDVDENTVTLFVYVTWLNLKARYKGNAGSGDLLISLSNMEFTVALKISDVADELVPFLQADPTCKLRVPIPPVMTFNADFADKCQGLGWIAAAGCYVITPLWWGAEGVEGIAGNVIGPGILQEFLETEGCGFVKEKLKPLLLNLTNEAKEAMREASISVPIARNVSMGIVQRGLRTTDKGILSVPLALAFRFGSEELAEKAKLISGVLDLCPTGGSRQEANKIPNPKLNMLGLTLTSAMLRHLIGVIMATELGPINGDSEKIGEYLKIVGCTAKVCLANLFGLIPAHDPRLNAVDSGIECTARGDLENAKEVCASEFNAVDTSVYAIVPLKMNCVVKLNDSTVLDVMQAGVRLTVEIPDIQMSSARIFVDESAEITLAAEFNNTRLLYASKSKMFSAPDPEMMADTLGMLWDYSKDIVLEFLKNETTKGIEIPVLGPVTIQKARMVTSEEALANGDDVLTAVADIKLNITAF